jgi:sarcosine oxidase
VSADVAVVGAGIMGAATARALAREGVEVVVYEQFRPGHDRGSSHGRSRIFRLAYADAGWVRLAQEALVGWHELERESGEQLLELSGLVEIVDDLADSSSAALDECGAAWELLSPEEAERRFPLRLEPGTVAVLQPEAGIVYADRALSAFLRGVRVEAERPVRSLAEVDARVLVVAAGAWARGLLAEAGVSLDVRVTRETVCYFRLDDPRPVPSVAKLRPGTHAHAIYALADPVYGLKVGCHHCGPEVDPETTGEPEPELVDRVARWVAEVFPSASPEPAAAETCLYTTTADESFVLERHGRIVVGSACSGHGFKFAPAIGERLARLALEGLEKARGGAGA